VLSFGYFSLHKQRKVTRSAGAKAFAVEVEVAVAFNNKQSKSKSKSRSRSRSRRAAEQAPLYKQVRGHCYLYERPWIPAFAGMTVDRWSG
jgi:hypothetical protein